jgi:hypothetical protein
LLHLRKNVIVEELIDRIGRNGEELAVHGYANSLLAVAQAEGAAEFDLIFDVVGTNEILQELNDLTGAFQVAGTADAYGNFHGSGLLFMMD